MSKPQQFKNVEDFKAQLSDLDSLETSDFILSDKAIAVLERLKLQSFIEKCNISSHDYRNDTAALLADMKVKDLECNFYTYLINLALTNK